jgi:hypothetical protein
VQCVPLIAFQSKKRTKNVAFTLLLYSVLVRFGFDDSTLVILHWTESNFAELLYLKVSFLVA